MWLCMKKNNRCKSKIAILDNAHLKVQTLCYFLLKSDCQMEIKLHLFEIMLFCFLHAILLFYYSSVMLKPNFLNKWKNTWFSHAQSHVCVNLGGIEFKSELFWHNETVSYKFSLYHSCVGVTFGHVELTALEVDIAIWTGSVNIYRNMRLWIFATVWLCCALEMWSWSLKCYERVKLSE